jgi:hypothetical protein
VEPITKKIKMAKLDQWDIVGQMESFAFSKGWLFVLGFTDFQRNLGVFQEYQAGQTVLIFSKQVVPAFQDGVLTSSNSICNCLLMRKFDSNYDGTNGETASSNIGETIGQKYTRRIKDLEQAFAEGMKDFACQEDYTLSFNGIQATVNAFDSNLDGVSGTVTFTLTL